MSSTQRGKPTKKSRSFSIGRVRAGLRGRVWYLYYHEQGSALANRSVAD